MRQYTIDGIIVLEPDDKKTLFNGETYSKMVMLGKNDKVENWWEVDDSDVPIEDEDIDDTEALNILLGGEEQ